MEATAAVEGKKIHTVDAGAGGTRESDCRIKGKKTMRGGRTSAAVVLYVGNCVCRVCVFYLYYTTFVNF